MWLILPTYRSSPESEDLISPSGSRFQHLARSVTSRTTSRSAAFWRREWLMGRLSPFRSGVTCEPSHADSIVAEWLASSAASLAPTLASPANEPASTPAKPADSGGSISASSATFNPHGCSSKTSLASSAHPVAIWNPKTQRMESPQIGLFATSTPFLGRWPTSGSMRNGCVYERPTWAPHRSGSEYSSWPAANWQTPATDSFRSRGGDRKQEMGLDQEARKWTTPQSHYCRGAKTPEQISAMKERTGSGVRNLNEDAASWSTPRSEDAESCGNHPQAQDSLTGQTRGWMSPSVGDAKGRKYTYDQHDKTRPRLALPGETAGWSTPHGNENPNSGAGGGEFATPSARDWKSGKAIQETMEGNARPLNEQASACSLPAQAWVEKACSMTYDSFTPEALAELGAAIKPNSATPSNGPASSTKDRGLRPRLNPAFDSWHMGFPWWWTRTAPISFGLAEMRWWLCKVRRRLEFLLRG